MGNVGRGFGGKSWMDLEGRNWDKEEIPGSGWGMHGYIQTYSRLKGRTVVSCGFSIEGTLISTSAVSTAGFLALTAKEQKILTPPPSTPP